MNPITLMLTKAKQSTSPVIAMFTWACVWVFGADKPMDQVVAFVQATDPLKLIFGFVLIVGSLFLGALREKPVDLTEEVIGD